MVQTARTIAEEGVMHVLIPSPKVSGLRAERHSERLLLSRRLDPQKHAVSSPVVSHFRRLLPKLLLSRSYSNPAEIRKTSCLAPRMGLPDCANKVLQILYFFSCRTNPTKAVRWPIRDAVSAECIALQY